MLYDKTVRIVFASSAFAQNGKIVIGKNGNMPWKGMLPSDMLRFKNLTKGQSVIMGRKTWESIPEKFRPFDKNLPLEESRQSIVLTRNQNFSIDDPRVTVVRSLEGAVRLSKTDTVWIMGGAEIYSLALPIADFVHQTLVYRVFDGDTFFPNYNRNSWQTLNFKYFNAGCTGTENDKLDSSYVIFQKK